MSILVVARDQVLRKTAVQALREGGYAVHQSASGRNALAMFREQEPEVVLIVQNAEDRAMLKVCAAMRKHEEVRQHESFAHILLVLHQDSIEERERGFRAGASDFMPLATLMERKEWLLSRIDELLRPEQTFNGLQALLVEDSPATGRVLAWCLKACGLKVHHASTGAEAYSLARGLRQQLDLVITEYDLPEMDGMELCQRLRTILGLRRIPILFICSEEHREEILDAFSVGATDYIVKPCTKEEILARLRVHLDIRAFSHRLKQQLNSLRGKAVFQTDSAPADAAGADSDHDLTGAIEAMSIPEIVQLLHLSRRTGRLVILDPDQNMGSICFHGGEAVSAAYRKDEGEEAVYRLFTLQKGVFSFHVNEAPDPCNLHRSINFILMDAARLMDECV